MKKNLISIKSLTLGMVAVATLGLGSCVDDSVSEEVKAIYKNQAALIGNKALLAKAEADLKAAEAALKAGEIEIQKIEIELANLKKQVAVEENAVKIAEFKATIKKQEAELIKQEAALVENKTALAKAEAEQKQALLKIASDAKSNEFTYDKAALTAMQTAVGDYMLAFVAVQDEELRIAKLEEDLKYFKSDIETGEEKADYKYRIAAKKIEIEDDKVSKAKAEEKLSILENIFAGKTDDVKATSGIKVLEAQESKEKTEKELETLSAKIKLIESNFKIFEPKPNLTYFDIVLEAEKKVKTEESSFETSKVNLDTDKKDLDKVIDALDKLKAEDKTYAQALSDETKAKDENDKAQKEYADVLNGLNQEINDLKTKMDDAFADMGTKESAMINAKIVMDAAETAMNADPGNTAKVDAYNNAKTAYDAAKALYDLAENVHDGAKDKYDKAVKEFSDKATETLDKFNEAMNIRNLVEQRDMLRINIQRGEVDLEKSKTDVANAKDDLNTVKGTEYKELFVSIDTKEIEKKKAENDILYYTSIDLLNNSFYAGTDIEARKAKLTTEINTTKESIAALEKKITTAEIEIKQLEAKTVSIDSMLTAKIASLEAEIKEHKNKLAVLKKVAEKYKVVMDKYLA